MEEKERYKWSQDAIEECAYEDYDYIVDTENNIIFDDDNYFKLVNILNQQDKRIKELETCLDEEIESNVNLYNLRLKTEQENQQLKQQVKELQEKVHILNEQSQNNYKRYTEALKENNQLDKIIEWLEEDEALLKSLIIGIDLIMHDKSYRFKNNDGTWYSRKTCKNLTREEVYEEIIDEIQQLDDNFRELDDKNQQLKQQLAITGKALEMACERVKYFEEMQDKEMGFYDLFGYENKYDMVAIIKQYKQQAKEMLGNEK